MRTAYINKDNKVVYIAAFEEDKIEATTAEMPSAQGRAGEAQKNAKGKFLFGGSTYDAERGKWNHILGAAEDRTSEVSSAQDVQRSAEEVFEVSGEGLGVGDIYIKPEPPAPVIEDKNAALLAEKRRSLEEIRTRIMIEKSNEEAGWQDRVQKFITLRDALIIEIENLQ